MLVMVIGMIPPSVLTVHAAHRCPECEDWIDGSPYCSECYVCDACHKLCIECGVCEDCSGNEICDGCSDFEVGDSICTECAIARGSHCPQCDECYIEALSWCEECGACETCTDICDGCSVNLGKGLLCIDCAMDGEGHCPDCGECYFEVQGWCEECLACVECIPTCEYCSVEEGMIICEECARDEGLHCPDCSECYGEADGDLCEECGICGNCAEICSTHMLCIECAISEGYHCQNCETCGEEEIICEDCGERCSSCADEFCYDCNLCSECVQLCPGCGACSSCAEICENCSEYCSECEGICDDCGLCLVCCEDFANFEGCDCSEWVCIENDGWEEHFSDEHTVHDGAHDARPIVPWSWDTTYHWHKCAYCDDSEHYTSYGKHTFNSSGQCTSCGLLKDSKILITEQPKDAYNVFVQSPYETHDERNIAHFSVKAEGISELTYTWYIGYEANGQLKYMLLTGTEPSDGEDFDGPEISVITFTDGCYSPVYVCCVISDEDGNEVKTVDAMIHTRHDYQYYRNWRDQEWAYETAERNVYGHILQCVGEGCDMRTGLRPHEDEDLDGYCDVCDFKMPSIIITKQPKNVRDVLVTSPDEDYDERNIAHFHVEAVGDSSLTYTWYEKVSIGGRWINKPLTDPLDGECFEGPDLYVLAPTTACTQKFTYFCIITDEDDNEMRTWDVTLSAKHNYQYFKYYKSLEYPLEKAKAQHNGHILQCVGDDCAKRSPLREHEDADNNFCCDICDRKIIIDRVDLTAKAPREGEHPSYSVGSQSPAYGITGRANNGIYWYVSDNGADGWKLIDNTHTFTAGKYYKISVEVGTASGFRFLRFDANDPNVWVEFNNSGRRGLCFKTYNKDTAHYITAEYNFGLCEERIIKNVGVTDLEAPFPGKTPDYTANVTGYGYCLEPGERYDYWSGKLKQSNGIVWYDENWNTIYSDHVFEAGKDYNVRIYLDVTDTSYYEFAFDEDSGDSLVAGTVNGNYADVIAESSNSKWNNYISYTFRWSPITVTKIDIEDLEEPEAGQHPDTTVYLGKGNDQLYTATVTWYEYYGNGEYGAPVMEDEIFADNMTYRAEITIRPQKNGQNAEICSFAVNPSAVSLNGEAPTEVLAGSRFVYIYNDYTVKTKKLYSVSGQVTSFDDNTEDITLQLISQGTTEPAYETIVKGNNASYHFGGVAEGIYTLKVTKSGHFTYSAVINVSGSNAIHNVTMKKHPDNVVIGDTNSDGDVSARDSNVLVRIISGAIECKEGSREFAASDIDGDMKITAKDSNLLKRLISGALEI